MWEPFSVRDLFNSYWDYVIIDTRPEDEYNRSHIGPAVNIPDTEGIWERLQDFLPEKRDRIILYTDTKHPEAKVQQLCTFFCDNAEQLKKSLRANSMPTICVLECCYTDFCKRFPFLCTPNYKFDVIYPTMVDENLFLSSEHCATSEIVMEDLHIGSIVNCSSNIRNHFEDRVTYHRVPIEDNNNENIHVHLPSALEFISQHISQPLLVHCQRGQSRSASIVIAYLMKTNNWSYDAAYSFVKIARPIIQPNASFAKQLRELTQ